MRVALVNEWLEMVGGAEKVFERIINLFPDSDIFSLVDFLPPGQRQLVLDKPVCTSFIQRLPFAKTKFRSYLPLFPLAAEALDVSGYDVVISNSHAVAKGVLTGPEQVHICYCHTPMRYAWDLREQYLQERNLDKGVKQWVARYVLQQLRLWDIASSRNVDYFIANSHYIAGRIRKFYGREATVIYPPVNIEDYDPQIKKEDFYLTVSRMVPYKRIALIAEAFRNLPGKQLVIIGDGPEMGKVQKAAAGADNIKVLGYQPDDVMRDHMKRARAFIFAAKEDFGIVPVEAQAFGTPVIAYGEGGAQETVRGLGEDDAPTGVFFEEQSVASLVAAIQRFEANKDAFCADFCRNNALRFAPERFSKEFEAFFESCVAKSKRGRDVAPKPRRLALAQNE
ncbi:MAG: glycosyltransferase family 4 protein [Rhodospirillales bacterium]